ncbi:hypothetical protein HFP48_04010 [Rhodococcus sp. DMU1]|nr:hypothetical protein HFP48_04010 [Rhodococcus sp. DMU1]
MALTVDRFRALARSSPWRWRTLEFAWADHGATAYRHGWIRRPDGLRVETGDGRVETARIVTRPFEGAYVSSGEKMVPRAGIWPIHAAVSLDADGLVTALPARSDVDYVAPFFTEYHWAAMLNPVELADSGRCAHPELPVRPAELTDVEHYGRPTWQARVWPTRSYDPRCDCCALLTGRFDYGRDEPGWVPEVESVVRLDVGTGVCVWIRHLYDAPTVDLDLRIITVDEPLDDALFYSRRRRGLFSRRR